MKSKEEFEKLYREGVEIFPRIVHELNEFMPHPFKEAKDDGYPDFRTLHSFYEICIALALYDKLCKKKVI